MAIGSSSTSSSSLANAAASASSSSRTPLSIEDLLAKQKADKETASKPKFLTKQQRAELALARRKEETEAQLARQESEKQERERLEVAARQVATSHAGAGTGAGVGMVNGGGRAHNQQGGGQGGYGAQQGRYGNGNNAGQGFGNQGGYGGQGGYGANNSGGGRSNIARPYGNQGPVTNQQHQPPSAPRGPSSQRGPPTGPRGQYASSPLSQSAAPVAGTPTGPRTADSNGYNGGHTINGNGSTPDSAVPPTDSELDAIRARYLGASTMAALNPTQGPKKPRARKLQDKKFVFDWDASDDTSSAEVGTWRETLTRGEDMGGSLNGGPGGGVAGGGTMFGGRLAGFDEGGRRRGVNSGADDKMADSLERRRAGRHGIDERHWTEKPLEEMKDRDWRIFREDFSISTKGGKIPHPLRSWTESAIPPTILQVIEEIGYKDPSPIQRQAIPIGLQNRDLVGIAQTGSGKTAAFVIPMLDYIGHLEPLTDENRHLGPYALILAPTRELAQQIENETKRFATPLGYKTVSIVGGRSVDEQQYALRDGAEIVIATPGRLKDILDRSILVLSQCRYVVMDEADRMVDLGFELDLTAILDAMPADSIKPEGIDASMALSDEEAKWKYRVTTLFSATMPPVVERLTKKYLRSAATVIIGNAGEAVDTVEQRVEFVQGPDKRKTRLQEILRTIGLPPPMIVFVNEKKTADQVVKFVQAAGRRGITLHSGKNQEQREAALQALRDGEVEVLVATDLAGRGIDVPDVTCVINWQMASTIEKYVHRIGRTGRAGKQGIAITFLGNEDEETMYDLKQEISKSPISQMNPELAHHQAAKQRITREMKRKRDEDE